MQRRKLLARFRCLKKTPHRCSAPFQMIVVEIVVSGKRATEGFIPTAGDGWFPQASVASHVGFAEMLSF